jgi:hypothetical protein
MSDLVHIPTAALAVPKPRVPVAIRVATMEDLPFMDSLQKKNGKALGYFTWKQFEDYIGQQAVLIAEEGETTDDTDDTDGKRNQEKSVESVQSVVQSRLGYVISKDRYLKRDELGVVYQLCVEPGVQRKLVGASLIKAVFERSAYGCRLYCCWCAQDLDANYFWESLGFVPIAFRGGSGKKKRVHIFWQRRIREGDATTPWWFPAKTDQGAMREDRLVLPIPPGKHWSDEMPVLQVTDEGGGPCPERVEGMKDDKVARAPRRRLPMDPPPASGPRPISARQFGGPSSAPPSVPQPQAAVDKPKRERVAKPKVNLDPQLIAKARELRDRYLEHVNSEPHALRAIGKYEVSRLPDPTREAKPIAMLPAA